MNTFTHQLDVRWADLDPNFHVLHSKYYDFGATSRMACLLEFGLTPQLMREHNLGPILLKESCEFRCEIHFGDRLEVKLWISDHRPDYSRFSIEHEIMKNESILSARISVDIAWIDTTLRKMAKLPESIQEMIRRMPHHLTNSNE
jgi:acyl-CoA thioester hydrolase